jgi:hypothetical protein
MALGSTHSLTQMSTRNISWGGGKGDRCVGLTALPPSCADCHEIWEPEPSGTLRPVQGLLCLYRYLYRMKIKFSQSCQRHMKG